jgi:hypothetical protein
MYLVDSRGWESPIEDVGQHNVHANTYHRIADAAHGAVSASSLLVTKLAAAAAAAAAKATNTCLAVSTSITDTAAEYQDGTDGAADT